MYFIRLLHIKITAKLQNNQETRVNNSWVDKLSKAKQNA